MKNGKVIHLVRFWLAWTLLLGSRIAPAQTAPPTTPVTDIVYRADGTPASGTVLISWSAFTLATGAGVPAGNTAVTLSAGGALSVNLVANAGATPMGSYYTVVYHLDDGSVTREYWVIPATSAPVHLAAIRNTVLPASVAMQTVSKSYVDTAIAAAALGHPLDASTPYVLKTGDTMTGPLVLPGDPVTPLQASDKNYVDAQVAGLQAGLGQKVATTPQATQQVAQPAGTQLQVNNLNGALYASQYVSGAGLNGIANAAASADCAAGCVIVAERTYAGAEQPRPTTWANATVTLDQRLGQQTQTYFNPQDPAANNVAQSIQLTSTESAPQALARTGSGQIFSTGLQIQTTGLTGGSNEYARSVGGTVPYFKTTFSALQLKSLYNTPGQHVQSGQEQHCYGVGDCLAGSILLTSASGFRDDADEGTHPYDLNILEDTRVFQGTCSGGCSAGSRTLLLGNLNAPGTQGEGRFVIDTNPSKVLTTGTLIGGLRNGRQPQATFAGTSFPVSTFLETAQSIPSQAGDVAPGTVLVPIVTTGVPPGFQSNTAALAAATGVACIADATTSQQHFETAAYTVVDGSHLQLTLARPHQPGATVAVGGLCGFGLEQTVDTSNGFRQVFPVVGSTSATTLLYAGGNTAIVGLQGFTSAYVNDSLVVASIARTGNAVTVTTAGNFPQDLSGLTLTVQGVADSTYNGSYAVTTTGPNTLTYSSSGPDSTSAGGTLTYVTGGFALYPMAEVTSVYNTATHAVDGQLTLAANTVPWAAGDPVEEPHYFQELVHPDTAFIDQSLPRPAATSSGGIAYGTNNSAGLVGWLIQNLVPAGSYFGNGGTHLAPESGMEVQGIWNNSLKLQAGEQAVARITCNSHGCNKWNSGYNLFQMDTGVGQDSISFAPQSSTLGVSLRGTGYQFTPQAFTAGTINVTTLNAGSVHGLFTGTVQAASLPVFAASGPAHAIGAVPDPGATAGSTRFLREDGTWSPAGGGTLVTSAGGYTTNGPAAMPQRAALLGEYLMSEGTGATVHDTSGAGNDAAIHGATWDDTEDLNFTSAGQYVSLPAALNAARTWQFAFYAPVFGNAVLPQAPGYGAASGFPANPALLCGTDSAHLCLIAGGATKSMMFTAYNTDYTQAAEPIAPGWHVFTLLCGANVNGVVSKTHYLYDGAEVSGYLAQGDANTCPSPAGGNYQLGGSSVLTGTWWLGKVAAAWAWSTPLSLTEGAAAAQSALGYLKSKGIATEFRKVVQPAPVILAGLDSRTYGIGVSATSVWPAAMSLSDSTYTRVNLGSPGQTAYDACVQFDLTYGAQLNRASGPAIVALWGGVNDILLAGESPRQIANALRCMVVKAKAAGARVVLATEISCSNSSICDANRDSLNAILRAEAQGWGTDNLADLATDAHVGADGASGNSTCFPDALHPGPACEPYITAVMGNAINELLGASETQRHQTASASYQELAGDRFLDLTGSAAQTVSLPDCTGYSLPRQVLNLGTSAATAGTVGGQALLGAGSIAAGTRAVFLPVPSAPGTAGCRWERTQ